MSRTTVIRAGHLIDGTGSAARHDVVVWLRDGRIDGVYAAGAASPDVTADADTIDARTLTLLPGLIDTHVHLGFSASETPLADLLREGDDRMLLRAAGNAMVALHAGITTVRDAGGRHGVILALRDAVRDGLVPGPRIVASGMPITTTGGHCHWLGMEADTPDEVRKAARTLHRMGADFFKVMATGGNMTPGSAPEQSQYSVDALRALVEEARRLGKSVAAHVFGTAGIRSAVEAGVDSLEHCRWLVGGRHEFDEGVAKEIVRKGIFVNPNPGSAFLLDASPRLNNPGRAGVLALRPERMALLQRQIEMGTKVTAGTDAGIALTPFDSLVQNLEVLVEHAGMNACTAIQSATRLAAESMRLGHEIGTIEPGKRADVILVEGDPLEDLSALRRVRRVIQGGRTVSLDPGSRSLS